MTESGRKTKLLRSPHLGIPPFHEDLECANMVRIEFIIFRVWYGTCPGLPLLKMSSDNSCSMPLYV